MVRVSDPVVPYVGTWIEIRWLINSRPVAPGRSLRGNVDRNPASAPIDHMYPVVPYVGTWIEIAVDENGAYQSIRRSLRGNVDRNDIADDVDDPRISRSLRGNVDRNLHG